MRNVLRTIRFTGCQKYQKLSSFSNFARGKGRENFRKLFLRVKELEDKNIEEIKEEYEFDKINNVFDKGAISPQLDLFYGGEHLSGNFKRADDFLSLIALTKVKIL